MSNNNGNLSNYLSLIHTELKLVFEINAKNAYLLMTKFLKDKKKYMIMIIAIIKYIKMKVKLQD